MEVRSLGREDPLEEGMATHSLFLPGEFHGQRSLAGYSPWGHKESDMTWRLNNNSKLIYTANNDYVSHKNLSFFVVWKIGHDKNRRQTFLCYRLWRLLRKKNKKC